MTEQDREDELFSDPHPIAECPDDVALCFIPEPDEELGIDGFWEMLRRVEDDVWINERCIVRQPSHFVPTEVLLTKYANAQPALVDKTYPLSEVPAELQAAPFFDMGSAEHAFKHGRVKPGQFVMVDGVVSQFGTTGNLVRFN